MRMNVRVKGDNADTIKAALDGADGISEWRELGEVSPNLGDDAAADELRKLEEEHTSLVEAHSKLQQQHANAMASSKQLKIAIGKLDELCHVLISAVTGNPVEPAQEHVALNMLAAHVHKTQSQLSQMQTLMRLAKHQQAQAQRQQQEQEPKGDAGSASEG